MTKVAMPLDKLDVWLQGRTGAAATSLSVLDGFVTGVVAGPVSMDPPEWICPLLGIGIDAFNHGGTPEFAAISAVAVRHNAIVETLTNAPKTFEPIFVRKPGKDIDAGPWCEGFYAAMKLRLSAWAPLRNLADINHGLLLPILFHCVDDQGRPMLGPPRQGPKRRSRRLPRRSWPIFPGLLIVSPDSTGTACPLSGRNSTSRPVQISGAGSDHMRSASAATNSGVYGPRPRAHLRFRA
jgi:uncharacterized protein